MYALYSKNKLTEQYGILVGELGLKYDKMVVCTIDLYAATLLSSVRIPLKHHKKLIQFLDGKSKGYEYY